MVKIGNAKKGNAKRGNAKRGNAKKVNAKKGNAKTENAKTGNAKNGNAKKANEKKANAKKGNTKNVKGKLEALEKAKRKVKRNIVEKAMGKGQETAIMVPLKKAQQVTEEVKKAKQKKGKEGAPEEGGKQESKDHGNIKFDNSMDMNLFLPDGTKEPLIRWWNHSKAN
ncbi:hypothetical protein LTR12_017003 [Friedmanniomyces endolithicus]|nr:hypothetical protein LTR12_017003 [Friedmanniomyces endolithicus]